jgi:transcriptional regulator with XRE-family HTH domain
VETNPPTTAPPLRTVRQAQGLGLRETARRAGIDHAQLSRIERGTEGMSLTTLKRLAAVLGLTDLERHLALYLPPEMREPGFTGPQPKGSRDDTNDAKRGT